MPTKGCSHTVVLMSWNDDLCGLCLRMQCPCTLQARIAEAKEPAGTQAKEPGKRASPVKWCRHPHNWP